MNHRKAFLCLFFRNICCHRLIIHFFRDFQCQIFRCLRNIAGFIFITECHRHFRRTVRHFLTFKIAADGQEEAEKQFYVNTTAKPEQKSDNKNNKADKNTDNNVDNNGKGADSGYNASYQSLDAGGYSNGDAVYSGGVSDGGSDGSEASGNGSVPRVIVTGFSTDPAEVRAGSNFKLTIHLKNTSKMKVSNMLFDLPALHRSNP